MAKKQSMATRTRNAAPAARKAPLRNGKQRRPVRRKRPFDSMMVTPIIAITSVTPGNPVVPCTLTVTASCRLDVGQSPGAYLMDTSDNVDDIDAVASPDVSQTNPQWTFDLTVPNKTYAVVAFISDDSTGEVLASDSQLIST